MHAAKNVVAVLVLWISVLYVGCGVGLLAASHIQVMGVRYWLSIPEAELQAQYEHKYWERYGEWPTEEDFSLGVYNDIYAYPAWMYSFGFPLLSGLSALTAVCFLAYHTAHKPLMRRLRTIKR